uniref:Uncharacterized protein n=1 Tax=Rhizophora mucronata TaxID=61149 RepID=A0A2P2IIR0_RHIMU
MQGMLWLCIGHLLATDD